MNLGDPELEFIDPTPNVHNLFIQFDKLFFYGKLASRAIVRWSKRMYSCAGVCSYEGRGGLCDIALSEPLLKLRPRKNLVETLLHEMIHAFLFITRRDNDRDGHGPNFQAHMHRINHQAGIKITIYHDFHDEVKLYQTHVWRCNGGCRQRGPHFGIVRRSANRAPGPKDYWWNSHLRNCGGDFKKIEEPGKSNNKSSKKVPPKPNADITKYISTSGKVPQNIPIKSVLKDSNSIPIKTKSNGGNTLVISKKEPMYNPKVVKTSTPVMFSGKGQTLTSVRPRSSSVGVVETVRSIWANKQFPTNHTAAIKSKQATAPNNFLNSTVSTPNRTAKHKIESTNSSPPAKVQRIDDFFKTKATKMLKDIYGKDFQITQSNKDHSMVIADTNCSLNRQNKKLEVKTPEIKSSLPSKQISVIIPKPSTSGVSKSINCVDCPVCKAKVSNDDINRHLDECLNKEVIESLCKDTQISIPQTQPSNTRQNGNNVLKDIVGVIPTIPTFKNKTEIADNIRNEHILANTESVMCPPINNSNYLAKVQEELNTAHMVLENDMEKGNNYFEEFDPGDTRKAFVKKISNDKVIQKSDKSMIPKEDNTVFKIEKPKIKIEPGTSNNEPNKIGQICACCGKKMDKPMEEHLEECLAFFENNNTIPNERVSPGFANETIVIDDDDDIFDESQIYNATGTKTPCPCCLTMIEETEMADHLDLCLS